MMGHDTDYELKSVNVTEKIQPSSPSADDGSIIQETAHLQTRTRRLFNLKKLLAFHLNYMGTWSGVGGNMYYAMLNGGPSAWFFGYIIVFFFALFQVVSFAELASIQPIAGAQYYWTYHFATPKTRRFLTWMQGWLTWAGYISIFAGVVNSPTTLLEALIEINYPDYEQVGWRTTVITLAVLITFTLVNLYCFRAVPWAELITGVTTLILFLVFIVIFLVMGPRNSPNIFTSYGTLSGWDNYFVSSHVGALSSYWLFIGFESVIHMGEESEKAQTIVPQSMLWSIVTGGVMGFIFSIVLMFCIPSPDVLIKAANPLIATILHVTGSTKATTVLGSFLLILSWSCALATMSSTSRLTWAWARDGGLPQYFGYVDGTHRIPLRAVVLSSGLIALLTLLNLGSEGAFVALGAIKSLATMSLYTNAIILCVVLYARYTTGFELGKWNLGKWGGAVNVVALLYTLYTIIWFPFPQTSPVGPTTINYSGPVLGLVLIVVIALWFVRARNHWEGPNRAVVKIVLGAAE